MLYAKSRTISLTKSSSLSRCSRPRLSFEQTSSRSDSSSINRLSLGYVKTPTPWPPTTASQISLTSCWFFLETSWLILSTRTVFLFSLRIPEEINVMKTTFYIKTLLSFGLVLLCKLHSFSKILHNPRDGGLL